MACTTLSSITKGCTNNIGGIVSIILNDKSNITEAIIDTTEWEVTKIIMTSPFVEFQFARNVGNYTEEAQISLENGSTFYKQTIMLKLFLREASKSKAINIAGEGQRDLAIVVGDSNGKYWYFENAQLATDTGGSGTAKADGSNYEITFTSESLNKAYEVDPTIIAGLLAP